MCYNGIKRGEVRDMKKLFEEFKKFAFKGNVIDMAVGVMIGAAFGKIVASLVGDLFMPLLSLLTGRMDFTTLSVTLGEGEGAAVLAYGSFIQTVIDFLLIAVCIFLFVKFITRLYKKEEAPAAPARKCPYCRSAVDMEATRCPHCTSQLPEEKAA